MLRKFMSAHLNPLASAAPLGMSSRGNTISELAYSTIGTPGNGGSKAFTEAELNKKDKPSIGDANALPKDAGTPIKGPGLYHFDPHTLDVVESVIRGRWSCRHFDETRSVDRDLMQRILNATTRAPTGFNLQPWYAIVVQDPEQKKALCAAALGQPQVQAAPMTVVFAGDKNAESYAPQALEMGLESGYLPAAYGPVFLRNVYYFLHGGPFQIMALTKSVLSDCYSKFTGGPLLSVPVSKTSYAWKQTMIPATTFVHLCTAAGLNTSVLEGIDENAIKRVVGLSDRFTVPVIVCVGYARQESEEKESGQDGQPGASGQRKQVWSPRFSPQHTIRWGSF